MTSREVKSLSHTVGSVAGNIIAICGNALTSSDDPSFTLAITKVGYNDPLPYEIVYDSPTRLGLRFMEGADDTQFKITYMGV